VNRQRGSATIYSLDDSVEALGQNALGSKVSRLIAPGQPGKARQFAETRLAL
jgi:hypothetical protein